MRFLSSATAAGAAGLLLSITAPAPVAAQDGAFDMGGLTGTLSQDHNTRNERLRAGRYSSRSSAARTAQTCANVPRVRARLGADDPRIQRLADLCRRAGY